ncbi:MAG TPA: Clp protease N-terminal domain-containing protein, partial [bacterium]|nr:Clp protease N-terminal domain-containing protein [bacterium]
MKNLDKAKIVYCENCKENISCSYCHSNKYYLQIANYSIYFEKSFSKESIFIDNLKSIFSKIINAILIIIGSIGILSLFYYLYIIYSSRLDLFLTNTWIDSKILVFYLGVLSFMFLFYRIQIASYIRESIVKLDDAENSKHKSFNAYNALSKSVKKTLFDAHNLAIINKQSISPLHILYVMLNNLDFIVILSRLGISDQLLKSKVQILLNNLKEPGSESVYFLDSILNSYYFGFLAKSEYVKISHLLMAISSVDERIFELFFDMGVDGNQLKNAIA